MVFNNIEGPEFRLIEDDLFEWLFQGEIRNLFFDAQTGVLVVDCPSYLEDDVQASVLARAGEIAQ